MKRIPALQPLSRDHHQALVLGQRCLRTAAGNSESDCKALWREVTDEFIHNLLPHFHAEERTLSSPLQRLGETALLSRLLAEHGDLRAQAFNNQADERTLLARFGELLCAHVRFEERELFPAIQERLNDDERQALIEATG